jgi:hypothetical protein
MEEKGNGGHGDDEAGLFAGLLEVAHLASRSAGVASIGTKSLSCRFTPQARIEKYYKALVGNVNGRV